MEDWLKALAFSFQMVAKLSAIFIGWDWLEMMKFLISGHLLRRGSH